MVSTPGRLQSASPPRLEECWRACEKRELTRTGFKIWLVAWNILEHIFCLYIGNFIIRNWLSLHHFSEGWLNHQPDMDECIKFRTCRWDPNMLLQVRNFNHSSSKQKGIAFFYIYWFFWWLCRKSLVGSNVWLPGKVEVSLEFHSNKSGSSMRTDWLKIILL